VPGKKASHALLEKFLAQVTFSLRYVLYGGTKMQSIITLSMLVAVSLFLHSIIVVYSESYVENEPFLFNYFFVTMMGNKFLVHCF